MNSLPPNLINATNALVDQLLAVEDLDVLVKDVHLVPELSFRNQILQTRGSFLVIKFLVANLGKHHINAFGAMLNLIDENGHDIKGFLDLNAIFALGEMRFDNAKPVAPGFVGEIALYFDVPLDVTVLKLEVVPFYRNPGRQPSLESFKYSGGKGPDSGAGQELVGRTYINKKEKKKAKIYKVDRLTEIRTEDGIIKPEGVFLVVAYELENNGKKPINWPSFQLRDSSGRIYGTNHNGEAYVALGQSYKRDITVYPGQKGFGYVLFELVKEAEGLEIAPGFFD